MPATVSAIAAPEASDADAPMLASRWRLFAFAVAGAMVLGVGACMWGIPLPLTDNVSLLVEVRPMSLWQVLHDRFLATNYFRPFFWGQLKVLLTLSQGHYFIVFRGLHVLEMALTVVLVMRVLRVQTAAAAAASVVALMVLFGLHTLTLTLIEGPLTAVVCCLGAVALSFGERPSRWRDAASVLLLVYASLSVELGLLLWVVFVTARMVGCRGVSTSAVVLNTAVVFLYFVLRFVILPSADTGLVHRETGVGFAMLEPAAAVAAVGGHKAYLYAYNIGSAILTVFLSEPRAGIWEFTRRYRLGEVAPWQWIHIVSSALASLCLAWYVCIRVRSWLCWSFTREDRIVWVFAGVLAASAVMSFAYTREAVLGPAGVLYAMSVFVACDAILTRVGGMRPALRVATCVVLIVLSTGWAARAAGLTYLLRDAAFDRRNDWALGVEFLQRVDHMPSDPRGRAIVYALRDDALRRHVPSPRWAQPWLEEYVDRLF